MPADDYPIRDVLAGLLDYSDHSIVQLVLFFGHNQEVKEDTKFTFHADCMELTHASKGKTIIRYETVAFINMVKKGDEPLSWRRERRNQP